MAGPAPGILASTDHIAPTIAVTSPAAGNVSGVITLTATAADNDKVASVQFKIDGANIGSAITVAPYQLSYDTRSVVNGAHTFTAVVIDRIGTQTTSAAVAVTMRNNPAVSLTSPTNGATVSGSITMAATVTNYGTGITVQFKVDGGNVGGALTGGPFQVGVDTHMYANGGHTFTVVATDGQGNSTTVNNTATVSNSAPGAGQVMLGDYLLWNDTYGYDGSRQDPGPADGTQANFIWSITNAKNTWVYLPGNPNPTYYQMRVWMVTGRTEGGTAGNQVYIDFEVNGAIVYSWINGPGYTNIGPIQNVNGGEGIWAKRWCTQPGTNNCLTMGIGAYYDFIPKYSS